MVDVCDRSMQWLATAMEKEQSGWDFYKNAAEKCNTAMGKELFRKLMADEGVHMQRVKQIYDSLYNRKVWSQDWMACKTENPDLRQLIRDRIEKLAPQVKPESGDLDAIETGLGMEQGSISFYEDQLKLATDPLEKEFLDLILREERGHFVALKDLKLFFTNPESWYYEKERQHVDGA